MGCIFSSGGYEPPPVIDFAASRQPQGFGAGRSPARVWLKGLNLEVYSNAFLLAGYDTYEALSQLTETDLRIIERSSHVPIVPAHKMRMLVASSDLRQAASQSRSTEAPIPHPPTLQPSPGADAPLPPSAYLTLPAGDPDAHTVATLVAAIEEQHRETASRRQTREQRDGSATAQGPASPGRPVQSSSRRSPSPSIAGMAYNGQVSRQQQEQSERGQWEQQQQQQQQRRRTSRHEGPVERGVPIGVMMPAGQGADPAAVEEKLRRAMAQESAQVTSPIGTATDRSWHTHDHSQATRAAGRTSRSHSSSGRHDPELQRSSAPQYQDEYQAGHSSNSCSAPSSRQHSPSAAGRQQQQHSRRSSRNEGYESGDSPYARKQAAAEAAVAGSSAADGSRHSFTDHLRRSFAGRNVSPEPSALDGRAAEQQYQEREQLHQQVVTAWPEPGHRQYSPGASSSRQVVLDEYSHSGAASPAAGLGGVETQGTAWSRADQRGGIAPAGACAAYTLRSRRATAEQQLPAAAAEPQAGASVYSSTAGSAGQRPVHRRATGEQQAPAAQVVRQPGAGSRRATADQLVPAPPSPLAAQQPANALAAAICEPVPAMAPAAAHAAAQAQAPAPVPASSRARTSFAGAEPTSAPVLARTASAEAALLGVTATPLRLPRAHSGAGFLPQESAAVPTVPVPTTAPLEAPAPAPAPAPLPAAAPRVSKEVHTSPAQPAAAAATAALAGKKPAAATAAAAAKEARSGPLQQGLVYSSLAKRPSDQPATPPSAASSAASSAVSTASQRAAPAAKPLPRTKSTTKAGTSGRGRGSRIPAPPTAPGSVTVAKGKEPPRGRGGGSALSKRIVASNAGA